MLQALYDADFLFVAVAQVVDFFREVEIKQFCESVHTVLNLFAWLAVEARAVSEEVDNPHVVVVEHFAWQVADFFTNYRSVTFDISAKNCCTPACRLDESEKCANRCRFTGAVWPDESKYLSLFDLEIEVFDAEGFAIILCEVFG